MKAYTFCTAVFPKYIVHVSLIKAEGAWKVWTVRSNTFVNVNCVGSVVENSSCTVVARGIDFIALNLYQPLV